MSNAIRSLMHAPRFTLVVCLVLGIGIGASAVIWSALRAALIDLPPVQDPAGLSVVERTLVMEDGGRRSGTWFSYPLFETLRDAGGGETVAAFTANPNSYTLALPGQSGARAPVEFVSWNYFDTLGVTTQQGRVFASLDDQNGAPLTVVLSHGSAANLFGDAATAVGQNVAIDGYQFAVIGVADRGFRGLSERAAAFVPMSAVPTLTFSRRLQQRMSFWHQVVVRGDLPPGVASAASDEFGGGSVSAFEFATLDLRSARSDERTARTLWVAFGGVFALVLLACANAANLVMMRGTQRLQEFAVRIAMGADRNRLLREQLVEGAIVAVFATVVAVLFAGITVFAVRQWTPGLTFGAMSVDAFVVDARMVLAAAVIAIGSVLLSFLAPAFLAARRASVGHRDLGGRGSTAAIGARRVLVGVEIALATVLLVGAVLFLRSALNLQAVDLGYRTDGVVVADVALPRADYRGAAVGEFHTAALEQIAAIPGVTTAAFAFCPPPSAACDHINVNVDGGATETPVVFNQISAGYFDTLAVPVVRGRGFGPADTEEGAPVVVVSERAARDLFGSVDAAIGSRVTLGVGWPEEGQWAEVVGVVSDIRDAGVADAPRPLVYTDRRQFAYGEGSLLVHAVNPQAVTGPLINAVRGIDPAVAPWNLATIEERLRVVLARERLVTGFIGAIAVIATILAVSGVFALLALSVAQRTREIGIRLAVGARGNDVMRLVLREGTWMVLGGTVAGLIAAQLLTGGLESLLYGLTPMDPVARVAAFAVVVAAGLAGALLPARRASRVNPMEALRDE